ncbi:MAG TPA: chemotaxis protein CheW [Planctomycetota bacterium]|nr:chemotaxis protein CheW [Planctomycetota bacterium]
MAASTEILVFEIDAQRYGIPARDVQELVRAVAALPLPKAPPIVEGIINLRGEVVPVLDLRARFQRPPKPAEPSDHLIAARVGKRLVALRADRVIGLVQVPEEDQEKGKTAVALGPYVEGVAKLPDGLVLLHDLATFLSSVETRDLESSLAVHPRGPA